MRVDEHASPMMDQPRMAMPARDALSAREANQASDQRVFASVLGKARQDQPIDPVQAASEGAENLISVALVQPVLAKLRESSWAAKPFQPTSGEKSFRGMLDNAFALKIVRSGNWPLVEKVKDAMLSRVQPAGVGAAHTAPGHAHMPEATPMAPPRGGA